MNTIVPRSMKASEFLTYTREFANNTNGPLMNLIPLMQTVNAQTKADYLCKGRVTNIQLSMLFEEAQAQDLSLKISVLILGLDWELECSKSQDRDVTVYRDKENIVTSSEILNERYSRCCLLYSESAKIANQFQADLIKKYQGIK